MKKALLTILAILLMVSMLTALASCGGSDSEGGNGILPGDKLPEGTDFGKKLGTRFEFTISAEAYFGTEYNAQGNPLVRRIYQLETMDQGTDPSIFVYEYDAKGILKGYSMRVYPFDEQTSLSLTYDEMGRAVSGKATAANGESVSASWEYDKNNLIVSETLALNGAVMTYTFDEQGRIAKETVGYDNSYEGECVNTYTEGGVHQVAIIDGETRVDIDVTFDAEGYPLTVKGNLGGDKTEITYTYNSKKLCTSALYKSEYGSQKFESVYNDKDTVTGQTVIGYDEDGMQLYKSVREYTYTQSGKIASESECYYNENNTLENKNVYLYEYDAKGNKTKYEYKSFGADGNVDQRQVETWEYDNNNRVIESTCIQYGEDGKIGTKDTIAYEYDAKGNCVKETSKSYSSDGRLSETVVREFTYNDKNICVKIDEKQYQEDTLVHHEVSEYDDNGNHTKTISYHVDKDNASKSGRTEEAYTYDKNGDLMKKDRRDYDADGKMVARYVTEYKDGEPVKITEYDADGNVVHTEDYSDKNSNGQITRPEGGAPDMNDSVDKNDTAPEEHPKEENPEEYQPGIDYNGDGVIDEKDMPGGADSSTVSPESGKAPDGGAAEDSFNQFNPNEGAIADKYVTDNNR